MLTLGEPVSIQADMKYKQRMLKDKEDGKIIVETDHLISCCARGKVVRKSAPFDYVLGIGKDVLEEGSMRTY
jgi:hypothetical protein